MISAFQNCSKFVSQTYFGKTLYGFGQPQTQYIPIPLDDGIICQDRDLSFKLLNT